MLPSSRRSGLALTIVLMGVTLASYGQNAGVNPGKRTLIPEAVAVAPGGVRPVAGIVPATMRLGSNGGSEALCLQVVEVIDPVQACQMQQCVKVFPSRRSLTLKQNQRALLARPCEADRPDVKPSLLWGSASVLVLQNGRKGAGIWTPVRIGKTNAARLETEGSFGTLTWSAAGFGWRESPD
jgi:hypothetical protein